MDKRPSYPDIQPVIYQPTAFLSSCAFKRNQQAFLHSSLPTDNVPIVQGKCRVQRMSDLFAEQWALTLALQQFFHLELIFISIDKLTLIHQS